MASYYIKSIPSTPQPPEQGHRPTAKRMGKYLFTHASKTFKESMNLEQLIRHEFPEIRHTYGIRETMLYGLGVGACQNPLDPAELTLVYEPQLQALPSMISVMAHPGMWVKNPELDIDWVRLVHAEQHFELQHNLPNCGALLGRHRITSVVDKGPNSGALVTLEKSVLEPNGPAIGKVRSVYFLRGDGGCGNWGAPPAVLPNVPEGAPDGTIDVPLPQTAALLYRLSGDYNPLHADPDTARRAGFERPILHGLCTYGVACQSLVRSTCETDASRLRSMGARFTKPAYPGETLRTRWWRTDTETVCFQTISVERNVVVLDRGLAHITP